MNQCGFRLALCLGAWLVWSLAAPAAAQVPSLELGALGGGGMTFAFGGMVDSTAAKLAAAGSFNGGTGTSEYELTPSWTGGAYAVLRLNDWFKLGLSPHLGYLGTSLLATTDIGKVWERWSIAFPSLLLPVTARFYLSPGSGLELEGYLGPELGVLAGDTTIQTTLIQSSSAQTITPTVLEHIYLAATAGVELRLKTGLGWVTTGLGFEMAVTPVSADRITSGGTRPGYLGGPVYPCAVNLYVGWGGVITFANASGSSVREGGNK